MKQIRKVSHIFVCWFEHLRVKLTFLPKIFRQFFIFSCDFIILKLKMGYYVGFGHMGIGLIN